MTAFESDPPTLVHGPEGEQCGSCGAPLAPDQRYCLNCGTRRTAARVPVAAAAGPAPAPGPATLVAPAPAPGAPVAAQRLGGAWGVAALLLLALGVGVVIGRSGQDDAAPIAAAPAPIVVSSGPTGPVTATSVSNTAAAADEWPDQDGWTVQLGELPKDGTDQAAADAAKAAAVAKGVEEPGVLDAGAHGLTDGQLVLYSGVYDTKKAATSALADVEEAYPDARVIEVAATSSDSSDASTKSGGGGDGGGGEGAATKPVTVSKSKLEQAEKLSPEAFQKQSKRLPKTTVLPGKAPEKDLSKPAGGGGEAETIG